MVTTSSFRLRRWLFVSAALGLLFVPGYHGARHSVPVDEPVRIAPEEIHGLRVSEHAAQAGGTLVEYRYPVLSGAHALTVEVRTVMAERQTAFLEEGRARQGARLSQDAVFLAASEEVVGVRITQEHSARAAPRSGGTTRWYDAAQDRLLPWTALFRDAEALASAHALLAQALREEHGLPEEPFSEAPATQEAAVAEERRPAGGMTADRAWELARELRGSPLEDIGFSTTGGLVAVVGPEQASHTGDGSEIEVPLAAASAAPLLSEFGVRARDAAMGGAADLDSLPWPAPEAPPPGYTLDCARVPCVALTFDDGPGEYTETLLDHLDAYSAKATFYVLGALVDPHRDIIARMDREGHEVGNHSWKHDNLAGKSGPAVREDMRRTDAAIAQVLGRPPTTMRPPYGAFNATTLESVPHPLVLWDVDTLDWRNRDAEAVARLASHAGPGSIVLLHDIHESTVAAVPPVLEELHLRGYHFVTVTELFGAQELAPGAIYRSRD